MAMLPRNRWHKNVTDEAILEAMERRHSSLDNPGFCITCGAEAEGVEPDARSYECEACGAPGVFGIEELLMVIAT